MEKQILIVCLILTLAAAGGYAQQPGAVTGPKTKSRAVIEMDLGSISSAREHRTGGPLDFPKIGYEDYIIERDRYKADPKAREPYLSNMASYDSFYRYNAPRLIAPKLQDLKAKLAQDEQTKAKNPSMLPAMIEPQVNQVDRYAKFLMPDEPLLNQLADLRAKLEKLSGSSAELVNKQKEMATSNKQFPKAASSNPAWEAAASKAVANMAGPGGEIKILKAVTTTSTWSVKKNALDVPTYRNQWVAVGYSQGGKCYIRPVDVTQTYAGGGNWNPGYSYNPSGLTEDIPCSNIH